MINLLPYKEKKIIERIRFMRLLNTVLVGIIIVFFIAAILIVPTFIMIRNRYILASNQIALLVHDEKIVSDVDIATLENGVQDVKQKLTQTPRKNPMAYIQLVQASVPKGLTITQMLVGKTPALIVVGNSQNRELLQTFIVKLESNPLIDHVDNPLSNLVKTKNGDFKITITFK